MDLRSPDSGQRFIQSWRDEIRARKRTRIAQRHAQRLGGKSVILGEVLRHRGRAVSCVSHGDVGVLRLGHEKRL